MPIGILNNNDFTSELEKLGIISNVEKREEITAEVVPISRGRGNSHEVPEVIREIISEEAITTGNTKEIAQRFGVSKSSVDAYKHGATSTATYNKPAEDLQKHNDTVRGIISTTARQKLLDALDQITPDKVAGAKIRDIAAITKDLSSVVRDMDGNNQNGDKTNVKVMVYAPRLRDEEDFEVITVNE